jgi:hypothetical protein
MAGDRDEVVGVDELTDKLTEPSQKKSYYDYWNAAYRGFLPGGLNANKEPAPALPEGGDGDAPPFDEAEQYITEPATPEKVDAQPVVIMDDYSRVAGSVEQYFHTYQVNVGSVSPVMLADHDPRRTRILLFNVGEASDIYVGSNESVDTATGFRVIANDPLQLSIEARLEMKSTRPVWAIAATGGATATTVHVLVEYEKEI